MSVCVCVCARVHACFSVFTVCHRLLNVFMLLVFAFRDFYVFHIHRYCVHCYANVLFSMFTGIQSCRCSYLLCLQICMPQPCRGSCSYFMCSQVYHSHTGVQIFHVYRPVCHSHAEVYVHSFCVHRYSTAMQEFMFIFLCSQVCHSHAGVQVHILCVHRYTMAMQVFMLIFCVFTGIPQPCRCSCSYFVHSQVHHSHAGYSCLCFVLTGTPQPCRCSCSYFLC